MNKSICEFNLSDTDIKRFWGHIDIKSEDECWEWKIFTTPKGYGQFQANRCTYKSHRLAYYLTYGKIPEDLYICHKCNNRKCCNPKHLYAGTQKENVQDCIRSGKFYFSGAGEKHLCAKRELF